MGQTSKLGNDSPIPPNECRPVLPADLAQWAKTKFRSASLVRIGPLQPSANGSRNKRSHRKAEKRPGRDAPRRTGSMRSRAANNSYQGADTQSFLREPAATFRVSILQ